MKCVNWVHTVISRVSNCGQSVSGKFSRRHQATAAGLVSRAQRLRHKDRDTSTRDGSCQDRSSIFKVDIIGKSQSYYEKWSTSNGISCSQETFPGGWLSLWLLTTVGLILAILAILMAITALPVGDTLLWLVALELKSVTSPKLGGSGGRSDIRWKRFLKFTF